MDLPETTLDYTKDFDSLAYPLFATPSTPTFNIEENSNIVLKKDSIRYCDGNRRNVELFTDADSTLVSSFKLLSQ